MTASSARNEAARGVSAEVTSTYELEVGIHATKDAESMLESRGASR